MSTASLTEPCGGVPERRQVAHLRQVRSSWQVGEGTSRFGARGSRGQYDWFRDALSELAVGDELELLVDRFPDPLQ